MILRSLIALLLATSATTVLASQGDTVAVETGFRQGYSVYNGALRQNEVRLDSFVTAYKRQPKALPVTITGSASPEGELYLQVRLAKRRAETLRKQLIARGIPEDQITISWAGIDWTTMQGDVMTDMDVPARDEVLSLLEGAPSYEAPNNYMKKQLLWRWNGKAWTYLYKEHFYKMRYARAFFVAEGQQVEVKIGEENAAVQDTIDPEPQPVEPQPVAEDTVEVEAPAVAPEPHGIQLALKSNLLHDALAVGNIGMELYFNRDWTLNLDYSGQWLGNEIGTHMWRYYGGNVEVRRYLGDRTGRNPHTGWHAGIYGQLASYDFQLGQHGYQGKFAYGGGLTAGYQLPIARRWCIDFLLGLGYFGGKFKECLHVDECDVWIATKQRHWFGPTRAEVSLVWLLGPGNTNTKKSQKEGGEQ